jgi:tetratricopeptide (TPR) repeat protein
MAPTDAGGDLPARSEDLPPVSGTLGSRPTLAGPSGAVRVPDKVGSYKLLGLLGAGGMGVVYLAEQDRPRRQVALKVMRPGTATPSALRRFEFEAQALGRLQHEGIARIFEAGTDDAGQGPQPYFAMELIRGRPLTAYADDRRLGVRERLALVVKVCRAVQHAHQRGVIHRDLKPANVLVDEAGQPRVLDFGVARVSDRDVLATCPQTDVGQLVGTLGYMSPEQAAADPDEVDTRSDVYALGVLCYELLAGRQPHALKGKGFSAAVRALADAEPVPLAEVNRAFRGDLDTLVAKALEKDKARRYQTAGDLADDIERYLNDEPIAARPPGKGYYLRKFARRHRTLVTIAAGLLVALMGGTWLAAVAFLQRERAELAEKEKTRLVADGHAQAAAAAAQRGHWREAVAEYDRALEAGHADAVGLRLNKVRALLAVSDTDRGLGEIEALAATPDLGDYEGPVLLLQGDGLLGRDDARAEELIRQAQQKGLPPAAAAYADALLAETTPEAVARLRRTLALDSYQPRAHATLGLLLLLLGRFPEARVELSTHEALFPEDANAAKLRVLLVALQGDMAKANEVLDEHRRHLADADVAPLRALAKFLTGFQDPGAHPDFNTGLPDLTRHLEVLAPAFPRLGPVPPPNPSDQLMALSNRLFPNLVPRQSRLPNASPDDVMAAFQGLMPNVPLPPRLRRGFAPVLRAWGKAVIGGGDEFIADWSKDIAEQRRAVTVHPEGTIMYVCALRLFASARWTESEALCREAADASALFPVRRHALVMAAASRAQDYVATVPFARAASNVGLTVSPAGLGPFAAACTLVAAANVGAVKDPDALRPAVEDLRAVLALGPLRIPIQRMLAVNVAMQVKEYNLARQLLDDWLRQEPDEPLALSTLALVELWAGAPGQALKVAERGLRLRPKDETLLHLKKVATESLVKQARPFLPPAPQNP